MTRNLKALGLAVMATCAMSAMLAATAQANPDGLVVDTGVATAHLTGTQEGHHKFVTGVGEVTCENTSFTGTVNNGATALTVTPTYNTCTTKDPFGTSRSTTVNMTSCDYVFTGGTETKANHFDQITTSLKCPQTSETPHITVFNTTTHNHVGATVRCEFTVHQFGPHLSAPHETAHKLHNTAENKTGVSPDDVTLESEVTNVKFTRTAGSFFQCGGATQESDYIGNTTVRAYTSSAHTTQTTLTLTDP